MSEQQTTNEAQKTVIAFIAGLLIGGLLVWIFGGSSDMEPTPDTSDVSSISTEQDSSSEDDTASSETSSSDTGDMDSENSSSDAEMQQGDGSLTVSNQSAGTTVALSGAVFPTDEGWIGVREYSNQQMGSILGVARYSKNEGLVPEAIELLRGTEAGNMYAVVFFSENGDHEFNLATDVQQSDIFTTFTAN